MSAKDDACPAWERDALAGIRDMVDEKKLRVMLLDARKRGSRALEEAAYEKLCAVRIGDATDAETGTVERDVWRSVVETEELLREKQGRTVFLRGTRQMINGHGATNTVYKIVRKMNPSIMFGDLIEFGRPDLLFEAIALRHLDDFDSDTRDIAKNRLVVHGIDPKDVARK